MASLLAIIVATLNQSISDSLDVPSDWNLLLVNPWNPLPEGYEITLTQLQNGLSVDERCYPDLQDMMDDCRAADLQPVICSDYRSQETQQRLFNNQHNRLIVQGYSEENARTEAGKVVAVPGTSEHQLGLAVDIVDIENQILDEDQEKTAVQKWLMENSWRNGFILRYPNDKSNITGIIYEPWHYRYVGKEAAKEIYDLDVCLEEYLH
ncbi:M15 family metallopeptidase [Cuneatibacter sp. NSJ-177]|uniref:M15 family metallopeptidase n=1 Tax=Cuneatibacter sp. NSJ-177 TaxID=2931401 RepID=UPI001FD554CF|nr:M15 family metallopeptidase [Cuneatibacter sp. NSJ-177]